MIRSAEQREVLERGIRALCEAGDHTQGATLLIESYGRELLGFLISRFRERDAADEVFARFAEAMWRGLPQFRWQCSARVWCYTVARHCASHYLREKHRARESPISLAGPLSACAERIRTQTRASARTESKLRLAQLRKRYQHAKARLRRMAVAEGLVPSDPE
jgi:RNA polymerase sigma-70 factor, ECF subfamily